MKNVIEEATILLSKIFTLESYTYIIFLQVKMRTPKENIYYTILAISIEAGKKTFENIKNLSSGKKGDKSGIIYSVFHHIFVLGPTHFRKFPRAISIGRALFSPCILLFKKTQGSPK